MIRRLVVEGYKSLGRVELAGLDRLVLLFGPNAAGKSNLLDALDLLGHLAREDSVVSAFMKHRGNRAGREVPVRWFFRGMNADGIEARHLAFTADIDLNPSIRARINGELDERKKRERLKRPYTRVSRSLFRYRLQLSYRPRERALEVTGESLEALGRDGTALRSEKPFIRWDESADRLAVKLERQAHPRYFALPRQRTVLSEVGDIVNHPHLVAVARELASVRAYYVEPTRMRVEVSDIRAEDPGPHGESLAAFYHWLKHEHPSRYRNLVRNLAQLVPGLTAVEVEEGVEGFLALWIEEAGRGRFHAAMVSEGTLRLLCVAGIAATPIPPAVVGYEEPENGVHPARLAQTCQIVVEAAARDGGSQFLLTTHSHDVIDLLEHRAVCFACSQTADGSVFQPVAGDDEPLLRRAILKGALQDGETRRARLEEPEPSSGLGARVARGDYG
ncbi:MAG: AAA family ATPase [Myxococcales bacterium]|nr:AAA family ATPase [Myxococcales bacterium]